MRRVTVELRNGSCAASEWLDDDQAEAEKAHIEASMLRAGERAVLLNIGGKDGVRSDDVVKVSLETLALADYNFGDTEPAFRRGMSL